MSRRERRCIRKNTTIVSIIVPLLLGLALCLYSLYLGLGWIQGLSFLFLFISIGICWGKSTWNYETEKHDL